jgi:hypothetical protein
MAVLARVKKYGLNKKSRKVSLNFPYLNPGNVVSKIAITLICHLKLRIVRLAWEHIDDQFTVDFDYGNIDYFIDFINPPQSLRAIIDEDIIDSFGLSEMRDEDFIDYGNSF